MDDQSQPETWRTGASMGELWEDATSRIDHLLYLVRHSRRPPLVELEVLNGGPRQRHTAMLQPDPAGGPHWYDRLREIAADARDAPLTDSEIEALRVRTQLVVGHDQAVVAYPPEVLAYVESVLGLFEHWVAGTVTVGELSAATYYEPKVTEWRDSVSPPPIEDVRQAVHDVFARMAASMLSITEMQQGA